MPSNLYDTIMRFSEHRAGAGEPYGSGKCEVGGGSAGHRSTRSNAILSASQYQADQYHSERN